MNLVFFLPQRRLHDKGDLFVHTESSWNKANVMWSSTIAVAAFLCSVSLCVHIVLRLHALWSPGGPFIPYSQPESVENHWVEVGRNFHGNRWSGCHPLQQSYQYDDGVHSIQHEDHDTLNRILKGFGEQQP